MGKNMVTACAEAEGSPANHGVFSNTRVNAAQTVNKGTVHLRTAERSCRNRMERCERAAGASSAVDFLEDSARSLLADALTVEICERIEYRLGVGPWTTCESAAEPTLIGAERFGPEAPKSLFAVECIRRP